MQQGTKKDERNSRKKRKKKVLNLPSPYLPRGSAERSGFPIRNPEGGGPERSGSGRLSLGLRLRWVSARPRGLAASVSAALARDPLGGGRRQAGGVSLFLPAFSVCGAAAFRPWRLRFGSACAQSARLGQTAFLG